MKLSKETVEILKTFSSINGNLVINPGTKISTMSANRTIMAEYEGADNFDKKVAIFNLSEFLGAHGSFDNPELVLDDKFMTIKNGKQHVKYVYADESVLITPKKDIKSFTTDIEVTLSGELISKLQKMATVLSVEDLAITGDGSTVSVKVFDSKNPTASSFEVDLDEKTTHKFQINFKVERLRLFPADYKVQISNKKISKWIASGIKLVVYVAVESNSTFS